MSKPQNSPERKMEYDIKYLRKVLSRVDENIELPLSLQGDALRRKLESAATPAPEPLWASAAAFIRSHVFSLQSVVSYAMAFVVIMVITYTMGQNPASLVDGNIEIAMTAAQDTGTGMTAEAEDATSAENSVSTFSGGDENAAATFAAPQATAAPEPPVPPVNTAPEPRNTAPVLGQGGSGRITVLGEDSRYSYLARKNDATDPDRANALWTLEVVGRDNGQLAAVVNLIGITEIFSFFHEPEVIGFAGSTTDGNVLSQLYVLDTIRDVPAAESAVLLASCEQPGLFVQGRIAEGVLHIISQIPEGTAVSAAQRLPDSVSDIAYVITAIDVATGETNQITYIGADADIAIAMHSRSIYISYAVPGAGAAEPELYMAQIKLDGTNFEMVPVPDIE